MKRNFNFLALIILLALTACNQAGNKTELRDTSALVPAGTNQSSADDESSLAALVDTFIKSIVDPEKSILERIAHDDISYGHSAGRIENKAEFIEGLINGPFDFLSANTADQTIKISGDNAIVRHIFNAKVTNAGVPADLKLGILLVWKKVNGEWKLLARQAYKL